jgi:predicted  nucleic acid-binding Zn-ribbon protein
MMDDRLEMSPERMIEALNNEVELRDMEIERLRTQLSLAKAEIDGIHSLLEDVREDYFKERALVDGLTQAILDHLGASLEYNRD